MRAQEFIAEAELDPRGWGETPMATDVDETKHILASS